MPFGLFCVWKFCTVVRICLGAVPLLKQAVSLPEARSTRENICATENAVSALCKIYKFCIPLAPNCGLDLQQQLAEWFSWLPVMEDKVSYHK